MSDSKRDLNKVLLKEIDLIQACINRMAQNSFMIKGWTISLVAVVLALLPESFDLTGLCLIGSAIINSVPIPTSDLQVIVPPCFSTITW